MAKIKSFGASVYLNGIAVGGLTDISASGTEVSIIDTTSHDSAGGHKTFLSGLKDGGTLELTGKYNYDDAGQAEWKAEEGVSHAFYIILSDNSGLAFNAIVQGFQTSNPLDDAVEFTASAKITGEVFPVFPTITITGALTSDGSTPLTQEVLPFYDISSGRVRYANGDLSQYIQGDGSFFTYSVDTFDWNSSGDALVPQSASGWTPTGANTGEPIFAGS